MKTKNLNKRVFGLAAATVMGSSLLLSGLGQINFTAFAAEGDDTVRISKLEVNGSEKPLGIDDSKPVFSWQLSSDARDKKQSAYQVVVKEGNSTVWDSGKVSSENNYGVLYGGTAALKSKTQYGWTVTVWDEEDKTVTENSTFETGIMSEEDWDSDWIGAPSAPNMSFNGANWIWDRAGHNNNEIPAETLYFRRELTLDPTKTLDRVQIAMSADDNAKLYLNGNLVLSTLNIEDAWKSAAYTTVSASALAAGKNVIAVEATNTSNGYAGLLAKIEVYYKDSSSAAMTVSTDNQWKIGTTEETGWNTSSFDDTAWKTPSGNDVISYGSDPWGNNVSFAGGAGSSAPILRKTFTTNGKTVKSARAYIVGLGLYDLKINGANPYESVLNPANTDYNDTVLYDVYDVTEALKTGDNAISVELGNGFYNTGSFNGWNWGNATWKSNPKLRFELDITYTDNSTQQIYSGGDWKYFAGGPTTQNGIYHGETYDARNAAEYSSVSYDDSAWQNVGMASAPAGKLAWQDMEQMKKTAYFGSESGAEGELAVKYSGAIGKYTVTVPRMITGWSKIVFRNTTPGQQIVIDYGEIISADGNLERKDEGGIFQRDTYICRGGEEEVYEPKFSYKGFQYVQVSGYEGLSENDITCYMINTDVATTGTFESSNELLNTLHDTMVHTLLNNYQGKPTDTPYLEKNGWLGDVNMAIGTMTFDFDIARLMVKFLNDIKDAQYANGMIPQMAPVSDVGGFGGSNAPVWNSVYIFVVEELCNTYGMNWLVSKYYDSMKALADLDINEMKNHGWLWNETGILGDWVAPLGNENSPYKENPPEGGNLASAAYVWKMLGTMADYAESLNKPLDVVYFNNARNNILSTFNAKYLKNGVYDTGEWLGEFTYNRTKYRQTSNLIPLAFGMVPQGDVQAVVDNLVKDIIAKDYHLDTGVIGTKYILPVLCDYGYSEVAYRILTQTTYPSWGYWLEKGATSLWEMWESTARSHDHYFLGTYDEWFFSHLGGVKDVKDGYKTFTVDPLLAGDLTDVDISVETVRGTLGVKWQYADGNKAIYDIVIPFGSTAKLYLPTANASGVLLDGNALDESAAGVKTVTVENGRVVVMLGSGSYTFTSPLDGREVYKGSLDNMIAYAEKLSEVDYRAEGWTAFQNELAAAKQVQSGTASQVEINEAVVKLSAAIETLKTFANVNRIALKARIDEVLSSGVLDDLEFMPGARDQFLIELSAANKAARNAELTEDDIAKALKAFEKAFDTLMAHCTSNLALHKTATASSSVSAANDGWGLENVTDGKTTNGWSSSNRTNEQHEEWVQIDLGNVYRFDCIVIHSAGEGNLSYGMPSGFVIEISSDGEKFETLVEKTNYAPSANKVHTFSFEATQARYVRIRGTQLNRLPHESNVYRMQLAEVQVFNTPPADKSALTELFARYEALDRSLYTTDSLLALEDAMEQALALSNNGTLTSADQAKIDTAAANLKNALDSLKYKPGKDPSGQPPENETPSKNKINVGAIVGGVLGGVAAVAIGVTVAIVLVKRKKK